MLFLNPSLLFGLIGVAVPVIIHLFNRKSAQRTDWGAMRFLIESMASRTRRIQLEDALLMAVRCLILGMVALALARPFAPPGSMVPYAVVLPAILIAITLFAVAFALGQNRPLRAWLLLASATILTLTGATIFYESYLNLRRLSGAGEQDIALIIDASTSMGASTGGGEQTNFRLAVDEAREIILKSGSRSAFSIILAGPSPILMNPTPWSDRAQLGEVLDDLTLSDGQMRVCEAIAAATRALGSGSHEAKQIIILTDGQNIGWQTGTPGGWESLASGLTDLPYKPQLLIRQLPLPAPFRNLAVTGIGFSREVIGTDREVDIEVTLENTGSEAITPEGLTLRIGDETLTETSLGQFPPGLRETVRFKHHFHKPGAHIIIATASVNDDLPEDNTFCTALPVTGKLKVMIVDGNPAPRFFDRASAFIELALAPGMLTGQAYLIEPTIVPAPQVINIQNFDDYQAIILADVPRLPAATASEIAGYVTRGGGLLIAPGRRAIPEFYNSWLASPTQPLTPAQLENFTITPPDASPPRPSLPTFTHPSVQKVAIPEESDLASLHLDAYWHLEINNPSDPTATIAAKLDDGSPFVAARTLGAGNVIMTCSSLDTQGSNIATREAFLPFVHELIYYIADPGHLQLNFEPGADFTLPLSTSAQSGSQGDAELLDTYSVTGPRGQRREAQIHLTPDGLSASIGGGLMAGLYEMEIPEADRPNFPDRLTDANTLPFTVIRPAGESRLEPLTRSDFASISRHIEVLQPASTEDVLAILAGRSYGQELWKYLAYGALSLLVVEIALARWISINRKTGRDETIEFESSRGLKEKFLEQLKTIRS